MAAHAKKIAIIGAGWTGIGCLRILKEKGHQVDVYEKNNDIGGTWHPVNDYAGLRLHAPALTIEYFDFPLPSSIDPFERMHSWQVFQYFKAYSNYHHFEKNISLNKTIKKISYNSKTKKSILQYLDENSEIQESPEYDYVIYTNGYCYKHLPKFKNDEIFQGKIYHSFSVSIDLLKKLMSENKKIAVIGGSKAATDFILKFYNYSYKVNWLVRKPYWFFNYKLRKKWLKQKRNNFFYKIIFMSGLILCRYMPKLPLRFWNWFGLIKTYGKKHSDFKKFHFGMIDENEMRILKEYYDTYAEKSEIDGFYESGIILKNGKKLEVDTVICCTGSGPIELELNLEVDQREFPTDKITKIYRSRVIPEIPNLIFTAYHQFSIGTVNGLLQGNWIDNYIDRQLPIAFLNQQTTDFEKPFFSSLPLFDSSEYIIQKQAQMYYPFFANHEIATQDFLKWFLDSHFNAERKFLPFEFKNPESKK